MSGVKPDGHLETHDVIDMRFKCDECHSFIVGTRFHCNECEDFDLCFGCHSFGKCPGGHSASHKVTKFPLKTDTTSNDPTSRVQAYTHHHAWLQFAALAVALANSINEPNKSAFNTDYLRTAGQLHMDCLGLVTKCLSHASYNPEKAVSGADGGESSGEKASATGAAPETIPEGEGEEESKETTEGAAAATDKDKDVLKGTEEEAKDTKEVESDAGKATEASTSLPEPSKGELKTEEQLSESKADVESEEPSAESKPDVKSEVDSNESKDDVKSEEPSAESKDLSSEDKVDAAVKQDGTKTRRPENTEEIFASAALERLLGLLGAILPQDSKLSHWKSYCSGIEDFISDKFLPALFKIIRDGGYDDNTKTLALGILGKFLQCTSPDLSDRGVAPYTTTPVKTESETSSEKKSSGKATVEFLFQLGAEYLARSDLTASSGMASTLQLLASSSQWQPSVADHVGLCLERLAEPTENVDLSAVFGLLVFARFPNVVRMGSVSEMKDVSGEKRKAVVLKHFPDKGGVTVVDIKSRKKKTVKEHQLEESSSLSEAFKTSRFSVLLDIVVKILKLLKDNKTVPVERMWVLYLALKGLLGNVKVNPSLNSELVSSGIVSLLVNIASRGTAFSGQWILRDLEVLSLKLYKSVKPSSSTETKPADKEDSKQETKTVEDSGAAAAAAATSASSEASPTVEEDEGGHDPFEGLDDITKTCFETIHEAMPNIPLSVLRAIFESVGHDQSRLLVEVQRGFDGSVFQVSDELKEQAKKWEPSEKPPVNVPSGPTVDIGVVRYTAKEILPANVQAKPEEGEVAQKLIPTLSDAEIEEVRIFRFHFQIEGKSLFSF